MILRPIILIESPYSGDIERNLLYLRRAMRDSLFRDESPYASHALYTQPGVLRDEVPDERVMGMEAGWEFYRIVDRVVFYVDYGWSKGMSTGLSRLMVEYPALPKEIRLIGENP